MKRYFSFILMAFLVFFTTGCRELRNQESTNAQNSTTKETETSSDIDTEGTKPFEHLDQDEVQEIKLTVTPPEIEILLTKEQILQLIGYLNKLVIYEQVSSEELVGQNVIIEIVKKDGNEITLEVMNPFIIIDGVWYSVEYEICEEINQFANKLIEDQN